MSITFMPSRNQEHCGKSGLKRQVTYDCQCKDFPCNNCRDCGGTGKVVFDDYPFELNASNGNAQDLLESLGVLPDYSGCVNPQIILDGLDALDKHALESETLVHCNGGLTIVNCGRTPSQIERYVTGLREIAEEAKRRGVSVVWG